MRRRHSAFGCPSASRKIWAVNNRRTPDVAIDLYVWASPRDLDAERAAALIASWQQTGGAPNLSPFAPSTDVGWFYRELMKDAPDLDVLSDAAPSGSKTPIWLSSTDEPPARVVGIRLSPNTERDVLELIFSLAVKYDLVVFDARRQRVARPFESMSAYASATFWPAGAIRSVIAAVIGAGMLVAGYLLGIPVISWILELVGGFLLVLDVYVLIDE